MCVGAFGAACPPTEMEQRTNNNSLSLAFSSECAWEYLPSQFNNPIGFQIPMQILSLQTKWVSPHSLQLPKERAKSNVK
jgi:hypothetical protein